MGLHPTAHRSWETLILQLDTASTEQLRQWHDQLRREYDAIKAAGLKLDLTRGKPSPEQLALSDALDGMLQGDYHDASGVDVRNYGGLDGIAEAKTLFAAVMDVSSDEILVGGNSSLTLMYQTALFDLHFGASPWAEEARRQGGQIKFLAPVPGYDRHFGVCEHLGIELVPVPMTDGGPDMDAVEDAVRADPLIKGIWCVPRFSNPTGIIYNDDTLARLARLGQIAGAGFRIFYDNAYAVHAFSDDAPELANLMALCRSEGTEDNVYQFGSTSKITFAGAGVAFLAASPANLARIRKHLGFSQIGPDKVNQLRHVRFLKDPATLRVHMRNHAQLLKPRFDVVLDKLRQGLTGLGEWTEPQGGYFVSFDTRPGLAHAVVRLAAGAGVSLTPAGATFPYGRDPQDRNIRLAPSFPSLEEISRAMDVFVVCVKLASVRAALGEQPDTGAQE